MNSNKNEEAREQSTEQRKSWNEEQEKRFTQEDVDRIIKERLKRNDEVKEKATNEEFAAAKAALEQRENRLTCREYLLDKGYPAELIDIISTDDLSEFKKRTEKAVNVFGYHQEPCIAPLASTECGLGSENSIESAFAYGQKHIPKPF